MGGNHGLKGSTQPHPRTCGCSAAPKREPDFAACGAQPLVGCWASARKRSTSGGPTSVAEVVASGLCIGCGLCEAVTEQRVTMRPTASGSLRPAPIDGFTTEEEATILAACPGTTASPRSDLDVPVDPVWGRISDIRLAWAGDPDIRFQAATGGALTALGIHLLDSGQAAFVLHVGPDPDAPMRSRWVISETSASVRANTGSWYGPTAPLAGLGQALDRGQPFAIIAKPCDLGAVHAFARTDPRVDELVVARLTMVCGGQSRFVHKHLRNHRTNSQNRKGRSDHAYGLRVFRQTDHLRLVVSPIDPSDRPQRRPNQTHFERSSRCGLHVSANQRRWRHRI